MFGYFLFDALACIPILFYEGANGFTTDYDEKSAQIDSTAYTVFVFFKLFKLLMLSRISLALTYIEELLKDIFVYRKVTLENVTGYIRSCGAFGVLIHMFACAWLFVGANDWMTEEDLEYDKKSVLYVDALYFVTTTMTSVGYGDVNAGGYIVSMWTILAT